jgi:hypothetical protein
MLAVEIDGSAHDGRWESDADRQQILESLGLRFLRVAAEDVERNLAQVLTQIEAALQTGVLPSPANGADVAPSLLPSPPNGSGGGGLGQCP